MLLIFSDNRDVTWWISKIFLEEPYEICNDLEYYITTQNRDKIAFTKGRTFDYSDLIIYDYQKFSDFINKLSSVSRLVFSFDIEMHDFHFEIYEKCAKPNVYWITSGFINDSRYKDNIIPWMYFFENSVKPYKDYLKNKLLELNAKYPKPLLFDALLGQPREHRDFIYNAINKNNLQNNCILSYQQSTDDINYYNFWTNFVWEPNITVPLFGKAGTEQVCEYEGINIPLSRIIPVNIYNDTAFSIIAETGYKNSYNFYTEKTAKPLIAKRIFVMFSGYKMLENLKSLGFKTFDRIIDESYDSIENNEERWAAAFEQVLRLSAMDQQILYLAVNDILEHNYNHIMNSHWMRFATDKIKEVIYSTNK